MKSICWGGKQCKKQEEDRLENARVRFLLKSSNQLLLCNKPPQTSVVKTPPFHHADSSVGQKSGQGTAGMAHLCFQQSFIGGLSNGGPRLGQGDCAWSCLLGPHLTSPHHVLGLERPNWLLHVHVGTYSWMAGACGTSRSMVFPCGDLGVPYSMVVSGLLI